MGQLADCSDHELLDLQDAMRAEARGAPSLEEAVRGALAAFHARFPESIALLRAYATLPLRHLPDADVAFATELARSKGVEDLLAQDTLVLSLLATCGTEPAWNDRRTSKGHRAIPLVSAAFVDAAPMIARLLRELGFDLGWIESRDTSLVERKLGVGWGGIFHVEDAATGVDDAGRLVIPAQDFVAEHHVETVFGLASVWPTGSILTLVAFTRERLPRSTVEAFLPLVRALKVATTDLVAEGRLYD